MPIWIDNHEPEDIIEDLRNQGVDVEVRHIVSGDYVFGEVGIERKSADNLLYSLKNKQTPGQLWEQLGMLNRTYDIPILLVEGNYFYDPVFEGTLDTITLFWPKIRIVMTEDSKHTAFKIRKLYIKYGVGKSGRPPPAPVKKAKTPTEVRLYMLQCVEGVGPVLAKRIIELYPTFTELQAVVADPEKACRLIKGLRKHSAEIFSRVFSYL